MGEKRGRVFRNICKGPMNKTKVCEIRREAGMAGMGQSDGKKMETTVLEQQFKKIDIVGRGHGSLHRTPYT